MPAMFGPAHSAVGRGALDSVNSGFSHGQGGRYCILVGASSTGKAKDDINVQVNYEATKPIH